MFTGGLCIGYVSDAIHTGVLPKALRQVREERPGIHIALHNLTAQEQFEGFRQRSLDIALVCEPIPAGIRTCWQHRYSKTRSTSRYPLGTHW